MKLVFLFYISCLLATAITSGVEEDGERWAVLVAGSHKWVHYRHQASVCHAYQLLHNQGIPDDHIVVIMYDDIAYNTQNPNPGVILNEPEGPNVYDGVPIDYKGIHVTPTNFLKVLAGDDTGMADIGSGKVIKSGPNDRIFIDLVDGGGFDHFAFPYSILTAQTLHNHISQMYADKKFKEMMIFIESNDSGSMILNRYPDEMGVYAMTATGEIGNAYAVHWSAELDTWMADAFTLAWMKNSEMNDPTKQTIEEQFNQTREWVARSAVHCYGNMNIQQEFVSAFFGEWKSNSSFNFDLEEFGRLQKDAVPSIDAPIVYLKNHLKSAETEEEIVYWSQQLTSLEKKRNFLEDTTRNIVLSLTKNEELTKEIMNSSDREVNDWDCFGPAVEAFHENCFNLGQNHYGFRMLGTLLSLCAHGYSADEIIKATESVCVFPKFVDID
ncbi:legumain-like [Palaemon carinicauda]|uniref:legumain-like n=1 Tax=Palaemon carinicauda TaxID=392227 RepID=UPI0035B587A6